MTLLIKYYMILNCMLSFVSIADWYEHFNGIAILAKEAKGSEAKIQTKLKEILSYLEQENIRTSDGRPLVTQARLAYSNAVKERAKSLHEKMRQGLAAIDPKEANQKPAVSFQLRDFYHDAYYCAFYACRYLLIQNSAWDTTSHKNIDSLLEDLSVKKETLGDSSPPSAEKIQAIIAGLKDLRKTRDKADYVMTQEVLTILAGETNFKRAESFVETIAKDTGVLT